MNEPRQTPTESARQWQDQLVGQIWKEMRGHWENGNKSPVEDYLKQHPQAAQNSGMVLDLIYAEFSLREESGEHPQVEEYIQRFPDLKQALLRQFALHEALSGGESTKLGSATITMEPFSPEDTLPGPEVRLERIGKYQILGELGQGGQGTVYRGFHPALQQNVVIKLSRKPLSGKETENAFREEGRILAQLQHPNLLGVFDFDLHEGKPFLVMEYIAGKSLQQTVKRRPLSPVEAASLIATVARCLDVVHQQGVIHRDLKPANILLDEQGTPRIIDFGLAFLRSSWIPDASEASYIAGTLGFMAPEQAAGDLDQTDERTDIFSLGGTLFYLLTGHSPYEGKSLAEVLPRVQAGEWNRSLFASVAVPAKLQAICEKAMAPASTDRYPTAAAMAKELENFASPRVSRRTILVSGLAAMGGMGAGFWWWNSRQNQETAAHPRSRDDVPSPASVTQPVPQPALQVRVWAGEAYRDIARSLPLQTGDEIQLQVDCPASWNVALFWFDSRGAWHHLTSVSADGEEQSLQFPMGSQSVTLDPPSGTELLIAAGWQSGKISLTDFVNQLPKNTPLPQLPPYALLQLSRTKVTVDDLGKAPGLIKNREDPAGETAARMEFLRKQFRAQFDLLVGVAFCHR